MYQKQIQKVLTGGVNLLPPSDMLQEHQAEYALNWRVDQVGALKARQGTTLLYGGYPSYVHTLALVEGTARTAAQRDRYVGADEYLYLRDQLVTLAGTSMPATYDGTQLGWASYRGYLWVMNQARQSRVDGELAYAWTPAAPGAASTVAKTTGTLGGTVRYYVTYDTADGHESNPSPVSADVSDTAASFGVTLSDIPTSGDPQVTMRRIYREGGQLPGPYRVHTLADNTTTTWTDDGTNDDELIVRAPGILLEFDHDPAPEAQGLAGPYFHRLLVFASGGHPNRLWYTPQMMPWYFPGSDDDAEGNWVDVGELAEAIVAVSVRPRYCVIYKEKSIWRLVGDLENGVLEQTNSDTGLIGRRAWAQCGSFDVFQGKEGLHRFNGDTAEKITDNLDPIFKGMTAGSIIKRRPVEEDGREFACMAFKHGRLYYSYREAI
jgi:hypothetical protein